MPYTKTSNFVGAQLGYANVVNIFIKTNKKNVFFTFAFLFYCSKAEIN